MVVSNKRLTRGPRVWLETYLPAAVPFIRPARLMYLLKWNAGCYLGQGRGSRREAAQGPEVCVLRVGAIQTLIFSHTWCFLCGWGHMMRQWGNQRYQAGRGFSERSSAYCLTPTLNIHHHRQVICCLRNHPSLQLAAVQLKSISDSSVGFCRFQEVKFKTSDNN